MGVGPGLFGVGVELGFSAADEGGLEAQARVRQERENLRTVRGRRSAQAILDRSSTLEYPTHVDTQVMRRVPVESTLGLRELGEHTARVPSLHVHESAGVKDQALVEVAAFFPPGVLQHLVALPELSPIEAIDELDEGGGEAQGLLGMSGGFGPEPV